MYIETRPNLLHTTQDRIPLEITERSLETLNEKVIGLQRRLLQDPCISHNKEKREEVLTLLKNALQEIETRLNAIHGKVPVN